MFINSKITCVNIGQEREKNINNLLYVSSLYLDRRQLTRVTYVNRSAIHRFWKSKQSLKRLSTPFLRTSLSRRLKANKKCLSVGEIMCSRLIYFRCNLHNFSSLKSKKVIDIFKRNVSINRDILSIGSRNLSKVQWSCHGSVISIRNIMFLSIKPVHCSVGLYRFDRIERWDPWVDRQISAQSYVCPNFTKSLITYIELYPTWLIKNQIIRSNSRVRNNYFNERHITWYFFLRHNVWTGWCWVMCSTKMWRETKKKEPAEAEWEQEK